MIIRTLGTDHALGDSIVLAKTCEFQEGKLTALVRMQCQILGLRPLDRIAFSSVAAGAVGFVC